MKRSRPHAGARDPARTPSRRATIEPATSGLTWWVAAGFATLGIGVAAYLLYASLRGLVPVCLAGACDRVAASPFARFLGLPVSAWGLALFLAVAAGAVTGAFRQRARAALRPVLLALVVFGAVFSAYLVWLQLGVLRALCVWCAVSAALWEALLVNVLLLVYRAHE